MATFPNFFTVISDPSIPTNTGSICVIIGVSYTIITVLCFWSVAPNTCIGANAPIDATVVSSPPLNAYAFLIHIQCCVIITHGIFSALIAMMSSWTMAAVGTLEVTFTRPTRAIRTCPSVVTLALTA